MQEKHRLSRLLRCLGQGAHWPGTFSPLIIIYVLYSSVWSWYSTLKTGGMEISREKWDEAEEEPDEEQTMDLVVESPRSSQSILPDWTRSPLPVGAPLASRAPLLVAPPLQHAVSA